MSVDLRVRPPFPAVIDNTMRCEFVSCPQAWANRFLFNLNPKGISIHLHTGSVLALGLEHVRRRIWGPEHASLDDALVSAFRVMASAWEGVDSGDHIKNFVSTYAALEYYFSKYPPETDNIQPLIIHGEPAVEFNFIHPIDVKHPETGDPILYCGRFDLLGTMRGERKVMVDEKSCMQLGSKWPDKWKLRSQFTGYIWGAQRYEHELDTAVVRAICFRDRAEGPEFDTVEAITFRPKWHVDLWYRQLCKDVTRMVQQWQAFDFDRALNETCNAFGGCSFQLLCDTPTPQNWVSNFTIRKWDPTIRQRAKADQVNVIGEEDS